jgi:dTDP-4-dehydrorhamnose reductase
MKVLITGAAGQLGSAMAEAFADDHDVVALQRSDLDLTDGRATVDRVRREMPGALINCAACNDVDGAESDPRPALSVNALAVKALARAAGESQAIFVHYSTDFVFDGEIDRPYVETDAPAPLGAYGASKLIGEWLARDAPRAWVLRVESLFGGSRAKSSIDRIIDALVDGRDVRVFSDRTVSPSYVPDVVAATRALLERRAAPGLYHCVNSGCATWEEVAREAASRLGIASPRLVPVKAADVVLPARRPRFAALSNAKLESAGVRMPAWQDAIRRYVLERSPAPAESRS